MTKILLAIIISAAVTSFTPDTFAQMDYNNSVNNPRTELQTAAPNALTQFRSELDNTSFDWRWLLPLLLVPFIIALFARSETDEKDYSRYHTHATYHDIHDDDHDFIEDDEESRTRDTEPEYYSEERKKKRKLF